MSRYTLTGGAQAKWLGVPDFVQAVKRCAALVVVPGCWRHADPPRERCSNAGKQLVGGVLLCNVHAKASRVLP